MLHVVNKKFRQTTIITFLCGAILVGLVLGRHSSLQPGIVFLASILFMITVPRRRLACLVAALLLGVCMGMVRGEHFSVQLQPYSELYGKDVIFEVVAANDAVYANGGQLEFDATSVNIVSPFKGLVPGTVKIQGYGTPAVSRGDSLRVSGKLFPAGGSRQGRLSFSNLQLLEANSATIDTVRKRFVAGMFSAVPEPEASFGLGLLIGQRTTLPDTVSDQLAIAGLTHIIAVSGYNLTIIVRMVRRALGKRSKYQSTVIAFTLIGLFILVTGFSASIVRAAVVSSLSLIAWYYGRKIKPMLLLLFTAALTALWNPIYLWSDIGWYLSFLAFFGVLVLAPLIKQRIYGDKEQKLLGQVVLESMSAQIMAAPLILYIFGEVSLIALFSNAIIVPLVPLAMLTSLFAGLAGMFTPVIAGFIALPATALLTYMLDLVALFARVPYALLRMEITLANTLYLYGLILVLTVIVRQVIIRKYARITDVNIIE